jgi:hypothetical protein
MPSIVKPLKTLEDIRLARLKALRDRLGRAGMVQFLRLYETGSGDYSRERHELVDRMTLDDIRAASQPAKNRRKPRGK